MSSHKILLVEDDEALAQMYTMRLQAEDFDVEHGKCFKCQMDYLDEDEQEKLLTEATKVVQ